MMRRTFVGDIIFFTIFAILFARARYPILSIVSSVFLEALLFFFTALAVLKYKRLGARKKDKKTYVLPAEQSRTMRVVHGYNGIILVPEDATEEEIEEAKQMARSNPEPHKYRLFSYAYFIILTYVLYFFFTGKL